MLYSTCTQLIVASRLVEVHEQLQAAIEEQQAQIPRRVHEFLNGEITPETVFQFEEDLQNLSRELMRLVSEWTYNQIEGGAPRALPGHVRFEAGLYRRLNRKTANRHVSTRFGKITLRRFAYRDDQTGDPCLFPLELQLGLVEGATPALADCVARYLAESGATQRRVLDRLKQDHGVCWGVKKLRAMLEAEAHAREAFRHLMQVARVLKLLKKACDSKGKTKPLLAVGRDGITLCNWPHGFWEVATAATISVYDRRGKRLGTVYLAYPPELGQHEMSQQLTRLLQATLRDWVGPLPRLCYVTDAGDSETKYYRQVLRRMKHPRTGERLEWYRIIDYYHATERITAMAEALFGTGTAASAWARKMRKLLKKPAGPRRVLHSAAAHKSRRKLSKTRLGDFQRAYNYIRRRTRWMDYYAYHKRNLPIGSGVTEAACKTLFTQRLKLSGMRWKASTSRSVLTLRTILLSGIWQAVRAARLESYNSDLPRACAHIPNTTPALAL